ncbi:hypothetical protein AQUCO_04900168v1 [Aquilegia coerulea]|uniref:DYW domain-containing protein n=1 Tax=Aquilegia coerulea TaxID=218851 RepID=A0A2G5CK80_AQUCA|nr:hypothetical protein AQUCO_04900168v1 [Aquilegia coerulea]
MTKTGLGLVLSSINKIVSTCAEIATFESLDYGREVFEFFARNRKMDDFLFLWNSLIRGYASVGNGEEAILIYVRMVNNGIVPDHFTFPFLLSGCTKISAFKEGNQVHGSLIKMDLDNDAFIQNSLIHFYSESGEMDSAKRVFDEMLERNVVSWTSLIGGYARGDCPRKAVDLFFKMVESGIRPNAVTMACVISACAKLRDLDLGERVCAYIGGNGVELNAVLVNALVDMYMKCGVIETGKRLFDECTDRNLVLYNTVMSNYVREGMAEEALKVFNEMLKSGQRPDGVTLLAMVSGCVELRHLGYGRELHGYILRNGLDGWDSVINAVIDMYMKCGEPETAFQVFNLMSNKTTVSWNTVVAGFVNNCDMDSACRLFKSMPEKDLVSWNTMIGALVQDSLFEEAIELFRTMQNEGMTGDKVTMVSVASACGYLGALDNANWVHNYIVKNEIHCDMRLSTALVDMYARCGDPQSSMQVFHKMKEKDVSAWTAAIGAMSMEGNGDKAIKLFNEMIKQGVKPDSVAYVGVLTACSHSGLVELGQLVFRSMKDDHGIFPQIVHYGCMVDLLGRAGLLTEAHELIKSMPMEPNDIIWGTLLAGCRMHNNVELAAYAAKKVTELAPEKTGSHILLSNVYASAGKWIDVARVRMNLKEKGIHKLPGSSSIEVNGTIHEFTSTDESHPQITHIARMLDEMGCRLKDAGHVPILSNVLLDVDEHEKQHMLSRHSEKLAMAFGLISTQPSAQIRVVKNLRMCTDCHSFAKLVSEIYNREIVVRDNNRFHFFRQGMCSCKDYW